MWTTTRLDLDRWAVWLGVTNDDDAAARVAAIEARVDAAMEHLDAARAAIAGGRDLADELNQAINATTLIGCRLAALRLGVRWDEKGR